MPLLTAPLRLERCSLCRLLCGVSELLSVTFHDRCLGGSAICLSGKLSCGSPISINLCILRTLLTFVESGLRTSSPHQFTTESVSSSSSI